MAMDRVRAPCVACVVALVGIAVPLVHGCRAARPDRPLRESGPVNRLDRAGPKVDSGRALLIGEMCPKAAGGRAAIAPLVMRATSWIDAPVELASAVERGSAPQFVVFGVDGKPAGVFDTMGLVDTGQMQAAAGAYVGGSPCSIDAGRGERVENAACTAATAGCGLAVAQLATGDVARAGEAPPIPSFAIGGACAIDGAIAIDIDGDGSFEQFALAAAFDGARPAGEWTATPAAPAPCAPAFQRYGFAIPGRAGAHVDILGVLDLDGDTRKELVIAVRSPSGRSIAVYTAPSSPQRLELAGAARSFPR